MLSLRCVPVLVLLSCGMVVSMYDFGYNECVYNKYYTKCFGDGYERHLIGKGLLKFPTLYHKEECLVIRSNEITEFPKDLSKYSTLYTLDVSTNRIEALPDDLDTLNQLKVLDLSDNRLSKLYRTTRYPNTLEALILKHNGLKAMPEGLEIPGLFVLDLSDNLFTDITRHFCVSSQLIRVDFTKNSALSDVTEYIDILNSCRNVNKISFCLYTDREYIKCSCPNLQHIVVDQPAFQMGTFNGNKIECSGTSSVTNFTGSKLFDVSKTEVEKTCLLGQQRSGPNKSSGVSTVNPGAFSIAVFVLTVVLHM